MEPEGSLLHSRHLSLSSASSIHSKPQSHFLNIHINIIIPSTPGSRQWFSPSGFPTKTLYTPLPSPIHATCPAHLSLLDFITRLCLWTFRRNKIHFNGEELLAPHPTPKSEDHPLSAVRDCLFNIFAAALHIGGRSSIRKLRTRHAVVTGTNCRRDVMLTFRHRSFTFKF